MDKDEQPASEVSFHVAEVVYSVWGGQCPVTFYRVFKVKHTSRDEKEFISAHASREEAEKRRDEEQVAWANAEIEKHYNARPEAEAQLESRDATIDHLTRQAEVRKDQLQGYRSHNSVLRADLAAAKAKAAEQAAEIERLNVDLDQQLADYMALMASTPALNTEPGGVNFFTGLRTEAMKSPAEQMHTDYHRAKEALKK